MGMPWVKIYVSILDDIKLARLTDAQKWRFVQMILLANECDAGGAIVTGVTLLSPSDITWRLRCDEKTLANDITKMIDLGLLHYEGEILVVSRFNERQGPTQEIQRKAWRERQKRHRERINSTIVTDVTPMSRSDVTPLSHKEEEEEEEEDLNPKKSLTENEYKERIKKAISKGTNTHEQLQNTFFELFHINVNWDRKDGKLFLQWLKERPPDQTVEKFAEWWKTQDWRGKSGQPPTIYQIQELWPQAFIPAQDSPASIASEVY